METSTYVALSGQVALDQRLATIAQNIANARTAGYRAGNVTYSEVATSAGLHGTSFASSGSNSLNEASGAMTKTGNPLDVAIRGNGYLAIRTPEGTVYSRDGRMVLAPDGQLLSIAGNPILDSGEAEISLDPSKGEITISADGVVRQNGAVQATLGLFEINVSGGYRRGTNSGIVPTEAAVPVSSFINTGFVQGFIEESNVNAISEMVRMIQVTRAFESMSAMGEKAQDVERNAIQVLGGR